eukprot:PRCOL_00003887-RA
MMRATLWTLASLALALLALLAGAEAGYAGGLSETSATPSAAAHAAAEFAMGEIAKASNSLVKPTLAADEGNGGVVSCKTQIVAGTMYHCTIKTSEADYYDVKVWAKLDGTYELTNYAQKAAGQ